MYSSKIYLFTAPFSTRSVDKRMSYFDVRLVAITRLPTTVLRSGRLLGIWLNYHQNRHIFNLKVRYSLIEWLTFQWYCVYICIEHYNPYLYKDTSEGCTFLPTDVLFGALGIKRYVMLAKCLWSRIHRENNRLSYHKHIASTTQSVILRALVVCCASRDYREYHGLLHSEKWYCTRCLQYHFSECNQNWYCTKPKCHICFIICLLLIQIK